MDFNHDLMIDATQIDKVKVGDYGFFGYYPLTLKKAIERDSEKMKGIITAIHEDSNWWLEKNNNSHNKFAFFYPLPNPQGDINENR